MAGQEKVNSQRLGEVGPILKDQPDGTERPYSRACDAVVSPERIQHRLTNYKHKTITTDNKKKEERRQRLRSNREPKPRIHQKISTTENVPKEAVSSHLKDGGGPS